MKINKNDAFKHCFSHVCATGITTLLTSEELVKTYAELMRKDLEDCAVNVSEDEVKQYLAENYQILKEMADKNSPGIKLMF